MKATEFITAPCGALPVYGEDGEVLVALLFDDGGPSNRYELLLSDGVDDGDAAALAAHHAVAGIDVDAAAAANLHAAALHAAAAHLHGPQERMEADLVVAAQGPQRRGCPAWVRRGAAAVSLAAETCSRLVLSAAGTAAILAIGGFVPEAMEAALALASAAYVVAVVARAGPNAGPAQEPQPRRGCPAWVRRGAAAVSLTAEACSRLVLSAVGGPAFLAVGNFVPEATEAALALASAAYLVAVVTRAGANAHGPVAHRR